MKNKWKIRGIITKTFLDKDHNICQIQVNTSFDIDKEHQKETNIILNSQFVKKTDLLQKNYYLKIKGIYENNEKIITKVKLKFILDNSYWRGSMPSVGGRNGSSDLNTKTTGDLIKDIKDLFKRK